MNRRALGVLAFAAFAGCAGPAGPPSAPPATGTSPEPSRTPDLSRPLGVIESMIRDGGVTLYLAFPGVTDAPRGDLAAQIAAELGHAFEALDAVARIIVSPSEACSEFAALAFPDEEVTVDALLADLARPGPRLSEAVEHGRRLLSDPVPWGEVVVLIGHRVSITETTGVEVAAGEGLICAAAGGGYQVLARTMPNDWARMG